MHHPLIFCADRIDVIMIFAVITNAVIKRVHCTRNKHYKDNYINNNNNIAKSNKGDNY